MRNVVEPNGRPYVYCGKCRTAVVVPAAISADEAASFAAAVRTDSVEAIRHAESRFSLGPREAKALVLHITRNPGKCNRCGRAVGAGVATCACRSLNFNW